MIQPFFTVTQRDRGPGISLHAYMAYISSCHVKSLYISHLDNTLAWKSSEECFVNCYRGMNLQGPSSCQTGLVSAAAVTASTLEWLNLSPLEKL